MARETAASRFEPIGVEGPSTEAVRAQLVRVTASRTFAHAPALRRFLEHVVDSALQAKTDELKEYAIGVDVFGRGQSFDPRVDTIVRVQARRLRGKLDEYYRIEGSGDAVLIELPKGCYVPEFRLVSGRGDIVREAVPAAEIVDVRAIGDRFEADLAGGSGAAGNTHDASASTSSAIVPRHGLRRRVLWMGLATGLLLVVAQAAVTRFLTLEQGDPASLAVTRADPRPGPGPTDPALPRVAVAWFENRTGDASLDELGRLTAERMIRVIAGISGVEATPEAIGTSGNSPADATALTAGSAASLIVAGAYYRHGDDGLEFQARLIDTATGRLLHAIQPVTADGARPADVLERLEQRVAGAVAIHFDDFFGGLDAVAHSPTLGSYREYRAGLETFMSDYPRTLMHLERAIEREPTFVLPLVIMYFAYGNLDEFEKTEAVLIRMEAQSDRLTPAERFLIEFLRANWEGRRAQAFRVLEDLERLVPGSLVVNFNLVQHAVTLNRPRAAIDAYARQPSGTRSLRHSIGSYRFGTLTAALHLLGEHERELAEIKVAQKYAPGVLAFLENEAKALAALGRLPELMRVIDRSLSLGPTAGWRLHTPGRLMEHTARELRAHGYVDESREVAARAVEWYRSRYHDQDGPEALRTGLGRVLFLAEQWEEADAVFSRLVAERPDELEYLGHLGPVAARRGDAGRARAISEKLASAGERLGDARARTRYFGAIAAASRAGIAAELGDRERAVELLREAFALGLPHGLHIHNQPSLQVLRDYGPYRELVRPEG